MPYCGISGVLKLEKKTFHNYGKLDNDTLSHDILGKIENHRTFLGPKAGVDYGIYSSEKEKIIMTTDPLSCHKSLGLNFAAKFGFHIVLTDFLTSGNFPEYMSVTLTLPVDFTSTMMDQYWTSFTEEAKAWSIDIVTGHTGRYPSVKLPLIGSVTMCGQMRKEPPEISKVNSGDHIYLIGIPGIQAAVVLSSYDEDSDKSILKEIIAMKDEMIATYKLKKILEYFKETDGILYIHDVTEGGLVVASNEISSLAGRDLYLHSKNLNGNAKVISYLNTFGIDWLETTSEGCIMLVVTKEASPDFENFMRTNHIDFSIAGYFLDRKNGKVLLDGNIWESKDGDPYWGVINK